MRAKKIAAAVAWAPLMPSGVVVGYLALRLASRNTEFIEGKSHRADAHSRTIAPAVVRFVAVRRAPNHKFHPITRFGIATVVL